jgi:hypothetical protein
MKLNPARQTRLELAALEKALGGTGTRIFGDGAWLCIRTTAQSAANLDLDALSDEARRLPELFEVADTWIAKRWGD